MGRGDISECVEKIKVNLEVIRLKIREAAEKSGRNPSAIQLIGVTKLLPLEVVQAGVEAGLSSFGENYPEQAIEKIEELKGVTDIQWHMIGHIQSRKTEIVCRYFDMVHSLDRIKIARLMDRYCGDLNRQMPVLLEVNLSGEESKGGWDAWVEDRWDGLLEPFTQIAEMENLRIMGLMSMPPLSSDPESTRPLYQRLRRLQAFLRRELPNVTWNELSIGTSFDYPVAIEEGATIIRVGTELFGRRPSKI
ncbi:MAG: YggS family pyridoxal phosphate-dependent enzyme [Anaerolineaceae bacterium]|nr:YggS family pyridoxal phosphate-dependent enzyme [Anaerolineaceae bacterium]